MDEENKSKVVIVIYLWIKWGKCYRRALYESIARLGGERVEIICIDRPICLVPGIFRQFKLFFKKKTLKISDNMKVYIPFIFLHDQITLYFPLFRGLNRWLMRIQIRNILKERVYENGKLISWIVDPKMKDYLRMINENMVVYECVDAYAEYPGYTNSKRKYIEKLDEIVLKQANIVFATSRMLCEHKREINANTFYVPNGTDIVNFVTKENRYITDLKNIKKPIIGFAGGVWGIFNVEMLIDIFTRRKDWSFIIIGKVARVLPKKFSNSFKRLLSMENVFYLGEKDYKDLPQYIQSMDVCLLPYVINEWTNYCCPTKFYQYFAMGKPIVSTPLPEIESFKHKVKIAGNYIEFIKGIEDSIKEDNYKSRAERIDIANSNNWEIRAEEILNKIGINK
jgi:glycosyltransferase involved in cell wall biosynthesis